MMGCPWAWSCLQLGMSTPYCLALSLQPWEATLHPEPASPVQRCTPGGCFSDPSPELELEVGWGTLEKNPCENSSVGCWARRWKSRTACLHSWQTLCLRSLESWHLLTQDITSSEKPSLTTPAKAAPCPDLSTLAHLLVLFSLWNLSPGASILIYLFIYLFIPVSLHQTVNSRRARRLSVLLPTESSPPGTAFGTTNID